MGTTYNPPNTKLFYIGEEGLADDNPNAEYLPRISTFDLKIPGHLDLSLSTTKCSKGKKSTKGCCHIKSRL